MYYKIIGDRTVFSTCKTIQMPNGTWVSNPSAAQIEQAGWSVYVPPVVPPQPQTDPDLASVMQAVKKILSTDTEELSDVAALDVAALFPTWASNIGSQVSVGERLWYDGKLWKVIQAHTVQQEWTPDVATSLFTEVSIIEWPEWVQPTGAQDAYMTGDKVTFEGQHYISLIDYNTYSPSAYPAGWELQP